MKIILCLLFLSTVFKIYESKCEYHWPKCGEVKNVVCENAEYCESTADCTLISLNEQFRRWILDEHNSLRNKVAQGQETRGGNAEAANMMALSYDLELEFAAKCNAIQCALKHDGCRRTRKYTAGQNLYFITEHEGEFNDRASIAAAILDWYEEVKGTTENITKAFSFGTYTQYTQLVWAETTHIGCARGNKQHSYYLVCNYGNAGNMIGQPVYVRGKQCSQCPPEVSCNAKYKGLCGEIDETDLKKDPLSGEGTLTRPHFISLWIPVVLFSFKSLDVMTL
ncbi:hypothetical protein JTB14_009477 [Gonioctena quinquepunctata]|nr:hypothetical protein JTB14_009477 [Gonioctena quinquepunctata]